MNGSGDGRVQKREPSHELNRLSQEVISAAIEVHRCLGPGFFEAVYEEALCAELALRGIPFARQPVMEVKYKGQIVGEVRLDLLVGEGLVVELKAVDGLASVHQAQVISYLRATGYQLGLLINFNVPMLKNGVRRIVLPQ